MLPHSLYLGAAMASFGHSESASGVCAFFKFFKIMQYNELKPHIGIKSQIIKIHVLEFATLTFKITFKPTPLTRADCPNERHVNFFKEVERR